MKNGRTIGGRIIDRVVLKYARAPDHPGKLRILRSMSNLLGGTTMVRLPTGALLQVETGEYIGWSLIQSGSYEPRSLTLAIRLIERSRGSFVDVGANFGLFTVAAAQAGAELVIAIEPDCDNCSALRRNIALNRFKQVFIFNGGAGRQAGIATISRRALNNAGSVFTQDFNHDVARGGDCVPLFPLDDVMRKLIKTGRRPTLIKIDIEGNEPEALLGIDWNGAHRPENILFEFNNLSVESWGGVDEMQSFFAMRGFELCDVDGAPISSFDRLPEDNIWARDSSDASHQ